MAEPERIAYPADDPTALADQLVNGTTPRIITGVPLPRPEISDPEHLQRHYMNPEKRAIGWYDVDAEEAASEVFNTPALITKLLAHEQSVVRNNPMRLWLQPGGHFTFMHYDGNSVSGLNLQVRGSKRWRLVSPHRPPPYSSFNRVATLDPRRPIAELEGRVVLDFETHPGEMLFLPRYWFHQVETLDPVNVNVNWVWTPAEPDLSTPIGRREVELLKLVTAVPGLWRISFGSVKGYGGGNSDVIRRYTAGISRTRALGRLLREVAALPRTALRLRQLRPLVRQFSSNNFNIGAG